MLCELVRSWHNRTLLFDGRGMSNSQVCSGCLLLVGGAAAFPDVHDYAIMRHTGKGPPTPAFYLAVLSIINCYPTKAPASQRCVLLADSSWILSAGGL